VNGRFYEGFSCPAFNAEQKVYAVLMTAHDITENIESTQKLKNLNNELLRSNLDLEQFAYIASHDLQEPLRKIQVFNRDPAKQSP
jgi:light-regulated signal transduction histidine kinase (bacteriophytochrome)